VKEYLESTEYIDWKSPEIQNLAKELATGLKSDEEIAKKCFEWVRDTIKHSWDYQLNPVTCKASDVLRHKTGYCYAKSHLLAALLRANQIPAGLCYQRLSIEGNGAPYCLHGLNAIHLKAHGWYRIDSRGNKEGVNAAFTPPKEQLAFPTTEKLEQDLPEIHAEPLPAIIQALTSNKTYLEVYHNLPDITTVDEA